MPTIIYLHGFASIGKSAKSDALIQQFGSESVFAPDLPIDPDKVIATVTDIVRAARHFPVVFVGTSLGGFWANYFAQKFDAPCVIVNPSISPDITMEKRIGIMQNNYATGESISITPEIVQKFKKCKDEAMSIYNGALVNIFLAKNDDVLDYKATIDSLKFHNSLSVTETGGHRYDEEWGSVVTKVQQLIGLD